MKVSRFFSLFLLALLSSRPTPAVENLGFSDSGIKGPKYAAILKELDKLKTEYPKLARVVEYGKSVKGRPLRLLLVAKAGHFKKRPTLLMTGSTHGTEYLNIEDRLPRAILKKSRAGDVADFLKQGGVFVFIPILNPDGYEMHRRENANGVDLNRDWDIQAGNFKSLTQIETKSLSRQLDTFTRPPYHFRYTVTVDYHCCIGAVLTPWSYSKKKLPEPAFSRHAALGELASQLLDIDWGTTGEVLGYYPLGTTKDYYFARYGALSFTYEGRQQKENLYFEKHLAWWDGIIASQLGKQPKWQLAQDKKKKLPPKPIAD